MKLAVAATTCALSLLARSAPALAGGAGAGAGAGAGGTCGGSSGSGSNSGSDTSSDNSSSSFDTSSIDTSSEPAAPACVDESDVVGYRRCTRFGRWANQHNLPPLFVELGLAARSFASPAGSARGTVSHDNESFAYRVVSTPDLDGGRAAESAVVTTFRIGVALPRGFYLASDGEIGGLIGNSTRAEMTETGALGTPSIRASGGTVLGALGVVGIRGAAGRLSLGAELAGGVRSVLYAYDSTYLACETTAMLPISSGVAEARARAALWLTPFIHIGATAGASVLERGAWMAGLHVGFATQAFAGLRE